VSGTLFVFEGLDGVGKTTLAEAVAGELRAASMPVSLLSFPGREPGTLGALVYRLHHDPPALGVDVITPTALQLLHVAAHLDVIEREIRPRLSAGEIVLLDRYWWSTWAYGVAGGADRRSLSAMIELERGYWDDAAPAAIFLVQRGEARGSLEPIAAAYQELAAGEPAAIRIDNSGELGEAVAAVRTVISSWQRAYGDT
jgi:dTMP kinase